MPSASWMRADGTCRPGERGEVVIKGANVIRGYENNPEANASSFVDGWFRTGDQGFLDADGYLTLVATNQGAHQQRRRENLPARNRRGPARASRGRRSRVLRRSAPHVGRRGRRGRGRSATPVTEADLLAYCRERLADFKRPKQHLHHRHHSAHGNRQDSAADRRAGVHAADVRENRHRRRRRNRRIHRRATRTGGRGRRAVRPRRRICRRCRREGCASSARTATSK